MKTDKWFPTKKEMGQLLRQYGTYDNYWNELVKNNRRRRNR
jgi:hypothetical protein